MYVSLSLSLSIYIYIYIYCFYSYVYLYVYLPRRGRLARGPSAHQVIKFILCRAMLSCHAYPEPPRALFVRFKIIAPRRPFEGDRTQFIDRGRGRFAEGCRRKPRECVREQKQTSVCSGCVHALVHAIPYCNIVYCTINTLHNAILCYTVASDPPGGQDGLFINGELVKQGVAKHMKVKPNVRYDDMLVKIEKDGPSGQGVDEGS